MQKLGRTGAILGFLGPQSLGLGWAWVGFWVETFDPNWVVRKSKHWCCSTGAAGLVKAYLGIQLLVPLRPFLSLY
ncbi:unnamed protein product [Penicillium camemberti]|uniref:Str. FM013 n=1 Tax=Penicillium camemberti (strain FM 013) TaxID=1429867 RepID=A0A0G4PXN9_PENC3|nr:unnamed protein product [Penicillium camemberti]